jgi:hypothetical protein
MLIASLRTSVQRQPPAAPADVVPTTFYCEICMLNDTVESAFVLDQCGHRFHRDCLAMYLTTKVSK